MNELFFELIRVAIGSQEGLSHIPTAKEWNGLYKMAEKQSLLGICFAGVQKILADYPLKSDEPSVIGMPEMLYLTWMGMAAQIQHRNEVMNIRCVELQERLRKEGFRNYIMKGQVNASLYIGKADMGEVRDLSTLRQTGDIDVYLEGGIERVLTCARKYGKTSHLNELEMSVKVFDDAEVEFHYRPFIMRNPFKNRKLQAFFKSQEDSCFANTVTLTDGQSIIAPTKEFNLVHQLAHIHLHLFTEGIGMRQLMDYYFVLKSSKNPRVQEVVYELGLERFASALMWVEGCVFGITRDYMPWEPNENDGRLLLQQVMDGGNFGRYNEAQNTRKTKMGYGVWALFVRNLKLSRFDRGDWFWGPVWRVYHSMWRIIKGYK